MRDKFSQSKSVALFLYDVVAVCKRHDMSLSHEDVEGAFRVQPFSENNIEWLKAAFDETETK